MVQQPESRIRVDPGESYTLPPEWRHVFGRGWTAFVALLYIQHSALWLAAVYLGCVRARPKTNFFTLVIALLLTATSVKLVWLVDPGGFEGILGAAARSCTLRLPQVRACLCLCVCLSAWGVCVFAWSVCVLRVLTCVH